MKKMVLFLLVALSLQVSASEIDSFDACGYYQKAETKIASELSDLYSRSDKLRRMEQYPDGSYDSSDCEEPLDEATYVALTIERLEKEQVDVRRRKKENCSSSEPYPY